MSDRPRVLVVEDAPDTRILVAEVLRAERFEVLLAGSAAEAEQPLASHDPDLVLLDVGLPDGDGVELCRRIRETSDVYVMMLTGRGTEVDRVVGLSVGADDYVLKPFSPRELVARVRARLRRPRASRLVPASTPGDVRRHADLEIDVLGREVRRCDEPVHLTRIEFDLLAALSEDPRRVVTRDALLEHVWGPEWVGDGRLVEVHVSKLRGKLGDDATAPRYIRTVRGVGYRMVAATG